MDQILPLVIRAPVAGVFYESPAPDEEPFVKLGDVCSAGTKIGIIESRKVFYPIETGRDGMVCEKFVSNGEAVSLDAPLVRLIRPPRLGPIS